MTVIAKKSFPTLYDGRHEQHEHLKMEDHGNGALNVSSCVALVDIRRSSELW